MNTILVVDDQAIFRETIGAALTLHGYKAAGASNGKEALSAIEAQRPDLVILDVMMPQMNAWTFLRVLRAQPEGADLRVILLTSASDKDSILRAAEYDVREYLLKDQFSLDELLKRVKKSLSAPQPTLSHPKPREVAAAAPQTLPSQPTTQATHLPSAAKAKPERAEAASRSPAGKGASADGSIPRVLTRQAVIERIEKFAEAKALPGVVANIVTIAGSPRSSVADLAAVLKQDPVLAARVLHVANSASFATNKVRVALIDEAVRNVGLRTVNRIAVSAGIFESYGAGGAGGMDILRCWQHGFAVAEIMDRLVPKSNDIPPGMPHIIGLCHDLGEIILRQQFAEEYGTACQLAAESGKPLEQVEFQVFGMEHKELVRLLSSKLGLPDTIATPIREFLSGKIPGPPSGGTGLAQALSLANTFAHGLLLASSTQAAVAPCTCAEYKAGFGAGDATGLDPAELRSQVVLTTNLLAKLSSTDEAALAQPILASQQAKIWYTRHASLAPFDPLGVALQFLACTQEHDASPALPQDMSGCAAIVIALPQLAPGTTPLTQIEKLRAAIQNPALPILCLSASGSDPLPPCSANTDFVEYPVPLARLHQFVSKL